jgi:ABC-type amino acid transport substrate-binding protein
MKRFPLYRVSPAALLAALSLGLCMSAGDTLAAPKAVTHVVYPTTSADDMDSRYDYDWAVLRTALTKTIPAFGPFAMRRSDQVMSWQRIAEEVKRPGGRINILARSTSTELEQQLLPVRLPIDRGLLGYRVLLVRDADLPRFAAVHTLDDLRKFSVGQGKDWIDVPILRAAGLRVVEGTTYRGLFAMLDVGRFDFFSRALDEAGRELEERRDTHPHMAAEPTLLMYYPLPLYFFLRRDAEGRQLARRIEAGMEMMIKDGSLNALFQKYKGDSIRGGALHKRRLLTLPNPQLPPETPLSRGELWFNPLTGK